MHRIWKSQHKNIFGTNKRHPMCPAWVSYDMFITLINFNPSRDKNHMPCKVCSVIAYPFPNFNGCTVEVCKWISNFISYSIMYVFTYPCWDIKWTHISKSAPRCLNHAMNTRHYICILLTWWQTYIIMVTIALIPNRHQATGNHLVNWTLNCAQVNNILKKVCYLMGKLISEFL